MHWLVAIFVGVCSLASVGDELESPARASIAPSRQAIYARELAQATAPPTPAEPTSNSPAAPANQAPAPAAKPDTSPTPPGSTPQGSPAVVKKHRRKRKPATESGDGTQKVVIQNGGTSEPKVQLSDGETADQASHQKQTTSDLLAGSDASLKAMSGRPLSSSQQDMANEIRSYMREAKEATASGDLERAYNLAFKAHLLSNELAGH
jgi:hypothetical protein